MENLVSIALKYLPDKNDAPEIVASGKDQIAVIIKKIAEKNQIPVVKDSNVAKILSNFPVGSEIPEGLYEAVAAIFTFINIIEKKIETDRGADF